MSYEIKVFYVHSTLALGVEFHVKQGILVDEEIKISHAK